jgi:hypothetical protein
MVAHGMGTGPAVEMLVLVGSNPEWTHSEAAFAKLCGACPIPASIGKTDWHRLKRGGLRKKRSRQERAASNTTWACYLKYPPS